MFLAELPCITSDIVSVGIPGSEVLGDGELPLLGGEGPPDTGPNQLAGRGQLAQVEDDGVSVLEPKQRQRHQQRGELHPHLPADHLGPGNHHQHPHTAQCNTIFCPRLLWTRQMQCSPSLTRWSGKVQWTPTTTRTTAAGCELILTRTGTLTL